MAIYYRKFKPTEYVMKIKKGNVVRKGLGQSFFYQTRNTNILVIPAVSASAGFAFEDVLTADFQRIFVQGDICYEIEDFDKIVKFADYTYTEDARKFDERLNAAGQKIEKQILNLAKVFTTDFVSNKDVRTVIRCADELAGILRKAYSEDETINQLGIRILNVSVLGLVPLQETRKALEAATREEILKQQDDALYKRRNSAIDQERKIKENELNTEIKIAEKEKEKREREMETQRKVQQMQAEMKMEQVQNEIDMEERNKTLVDLMTANAKKKSDAKAYDARVLLAAFEEMDPNIVNALAMCGMDSKALIAKAFVEIGDKAEKIGTLNVSPDLLTTLTGNNF